MRKFTIIALLLTVLCAERVQAWGGFGHGSIAYIAEQHLTTKAKEQCRHYLGHTLPFHASWMDHWRNVDPFRETAYWHGLKTDENGELVELPNGHGKALYHTKRIWKEMKNYKSLPDSLVRHNLLILIHMVPDMHCPVHVGYPRKAVPEKHATLYRKGKKYSFHAFWDASPAFCRRGWSFEKYAASVDRATKKEAKSYVRGSVDAWCRDIAKSAKRCFTITPKGADITEFSKEEQLEVLNLADEMAIKSAYRLAYILNDIFKK